MNRNVTDRNLLVEIYHRYYQDFTSFEEKEGSKRSSKNYVPIDCEEIGNKFSIDPNIVFGRLYYHLDKKHGYTQDDGSKVHLFAMKVGADSHAVHFPLLSAVVAELEEAHVRFTLPLAISCIALALSIVTILSVGT